MKPSNPIILFLQELLQRFFTRSPKFFRIWQLITSIGVLITGLPEFFEFIGVVLPPDLAMFQSKFIASVSTGMLLMSLLTTQSKTVAQTEDGVGLKTTDSKALPFTAISEAKVVENQIESPPTITVL